MELNYYLKDFIDHSFATTNMSGIGEELQKRINSEFAHLSNRERNEIFLTHVHYYVDKLSTLKPANYKKRVIGHDMTQITNLTNRYPYVKPTEIAPVAVPARMTKEQFASFNPYAAPEIHSVARESEEEYKARKLAEGYESNGGRRRARVGGQGLRTCGSARTCTNRRKARRSTKRRRS